MICTAANMSGNSVSTGWVVGLFNMKKQKTFQMKKTWLGKITDFMRSSSLIFAFETNFCHQNLANSQV